MENIAHLFRKGIEKLGKKSLVFTVEEAKKEFGLDEVIKLAGNTNPLGPSPRAIESVKVIADRMNNYPDPQSLQLRSEIAGKYDIDIENVLPGSGSSELITCIGKAFINEGDECLVPEGMFKPYRDITHIMGGNVVFSPLNSYRIDLADIIRKITKKTKLIMMVNPNNPTGDLMTFKEVEAFLNEIRRDIIVVFDEAYGEYVDSNEYPDSVEFIKKGHKIIFIRTLSKAYALAGSRIGYCISSPEIIECLSSIVPRFNVNMFAQSAAIEALKDQAHLKKAVQMVWDEKKYYYSEFDKMNLFYLPTFSNFIFFNVGVDDQKLRDEMLKKGVIITPLTNWGFKGFIRVSIGTHYENEKMIACLGQTLEEMKK